MIFSITENYLKSQDSAAIIEWLHGCIVHRHFIQCDESCIKYFKSVLAPDSCRADKELLLQGRVFDVPIDLSQRLTLIKSSDYSVRDLIEMSTKPSLLILENLRELEVYKAIASAYKKDKRLKNVFSHLSQSINSSEILFAQQAGGYGDIPVLFSTLDESFFNGVGSFKTMSVFDRDTDSEIEYDQNKDSIFRKFAGKTYDNMSEKDIYVIDQGIYHWHMWYRRAIENYFPKEQFTKAKIKFNESYSSELTPEYAQIKFQYSNYNKNDLPKLTKGMVWSDYERCNRVFEVNGESLSEFQLFLLKIMKII